MSRSLFHSSCSMLSIVVPDVALDAMQVLVDDRFVVVRLVVVVFHSEIALFCVVFVVEPVAIHLRRL